ncbi:hypothetical protein FX988_00438 [Paraglaciecola mesophila]|uniref:Dicarboxylate transport domain-containing protein n=1 Tax=Paraglaciecola mesophila TaxID=197222 RepID=A0A857JEX3_9ALTE|nr:YdbH domain-containing protein [Paraglaciecola mesophila]QHJ10226.1 hypothetical protein FX988_00438 [Paraglaciecola mesophila]
MHIEKACIHLPGLKVDIHNAHFSHKKNSVSIALLKVAHTTQKSTDESPSLISPVDLHQWHLPANLPRIRIDKASFNSDQINHPIHVSLQQPTPHSVTLTGDLQATLALNKKNDAKADKSKTVIEGDISWTLSDVVDLIPLDTKKLASLEPVLNQHVLMNAPIHSHILFDGAVITSNHQLSSHFVYAFEPCSIRSRVNGQIGIDVSLISQSIDLDLTKLHTQAELNKECTTLYPQLPFELPNEFSLEIPEPIRVNLQTVIIPSFLINHDDNRLMLAESRIVLANAQQPIQISTHVSLEGLLQLKSNEKYGKVKESAANTLALTSRSELSLVGQKWSLENIDIALKAEGISQYNLSAKALSANIQGAISESDGVELTLDVQAKNAAYYPAPTSSDVEPVPITIKTVEADITLLGHHEQGLTTSLSTHLTQVKRDTLLVNKLNNQMSGKINQLRKIDLTGSSRINGIAVNLSEDRYLTFATLSAEHTIEAAIQDKSLVSQHELTIDQAIHLHIQQQQQTLTVSAEQQAISNFQSVMSRFMPELTLQEGTLDLKGLFQLQNATFDGKIALANGALKYQEYTAKGAATTAHIQLNSAGLQLEKSTLHIESVNAGVPIENIEIEYALHNSKAKINHAGGDVLGGTFNVGELWLDKRNQDTQVRVKDISLAKAVALQQQSGIEVTGSVSGILPMSIDNNEVHIDDGLLKSQGPGTLKIDGNPAFDSIAEQQSELNYLRDLQFEQLSSNVTLHSDGLLLLDFAILGKNPNQQQAVNFNYHHEENVLTLLRSLRLTDSVQNQIEHKIKQGGVQ